MGVDVVVVLVIRVSTGRTVSWLFALFQAIVKIVDLKRTNCGTHGSTASEQVLLVSVAPAGLSAAEPCGPQALVSILGTLSDFDEVFEATEAKRCHNQC